MEFNNLRRKILVNLGHRWRKTNNIKLFDLKTIKSDFADIPENNFDAKIQSLTDEGHVQLSHGNQTIGLTHKVLNHLQILNTDNNNEEIIIAEKLT
jgi:hypothetical protein